MSTDPRETTPYLPTPPPDEPLVFERTSAIRRKTTVSWAQPLLLAVAGCGLVLGLGLPVVAWLVRHQTAAARPTTATVKDPYPECAAIRQWLREHTGAPDKLEVIAWGQRSPYGDGFVAITVRYRGQTRHGGPAAQESFFNCKAGRVAGTNALRDANGDLFDPEPPPGVITTLDPLPRR